MTNGNGGTDKINGSTVWAVVAIIAIMTAGVVGFSLANPESDSTPLIVTLLGIVGTGIPSLLAARSAERTQRDIRNGVLTEKVKEGTEQALDEKQVLTRDGPVATAELAALREILNEREETRKLMQVMRTEVRKSQESRAASDTSRAESDQDRKGESP